MGGEGGQTVLLLGLALLGRGEVKLMGTVAPLIQAPRLQKEGFPGTGRVPMGGVGLEGTLGTSLPGERVVPFPVLPRRSTAMWL